MKYLYLCLIVLSISFVSCDGKHRARETSSERIEKSQLKISQIAIEKYIPEYPTRSVTDTILNPNLKVQVKYFTIPDYTLTVNPKLNNDQPVKIHYREFASEITVVKDNSLLFSRSLSKNDFATDTDSFWNTSVLQYVWLDEFESSENNYVVHCSFLSTDNNHFKAYKIYFNDQGQKRIELTQTS